MKLSKRLEINGDAIELAADDIRLKLKTPGLATFDIKASQAVGGTVVFYCGYNAPLKPYFIGFVESCTQVNAKVYRVFCRELSAVLYYSMALALRACTLNDVLKAISAKTKLSFSLGNGAYASQSAAAFYSLGNGYYAMDQLGAVFGIDQLLWQQTTDGTIFVGSWHDSHWSNAPVNIANDFETSTAARNGATVPAIPALRPGALYNGHIITSIAFSGNYMAIQWAKNPWRQTV